MLLATGEQTSVALMSMAMSALGDRQCLSMRPRLPCIPRQPTVWPIKRIDTERIRHELDARKIVIITGFQGMKNV